MMPPVTGKVFYLMIFNERYKVLIHDLLLTLVGMHDVQLLVLRCPSNYPDDFRVVQTNRKIQIS